MTQKVSFATRSRAGRLHQPSVALRWPRFHAEHPLFTTDRTACGRNRARVVDPDDVTCQVCRKVMRRYDAQTTERQADRRKAYARALLRLRDQHRLEFDRLWEREFAALVADRRRASATERESAA